MSGNVCFFLAKLVCWAGVFLCILAYNGSVQNILWYWFKMTKRKHSKYIPYLYGLCCFFLFIVWGSSTVECLRWWRSKCSFQLDFPRIKRTSLSGCIHCTGGEKSWFLLLCCSWFIQMIAGLYCCSFPELAADKRESKLGRWQITSKAFPAMTRKLQQISQTSTWSEVRRATQALSQNYNMV